MKKLIIAAGLLLVISFLYMLLTRYANVAYSDLSIVPNGFPSDIFIMNKAIYSLSAEEQTAFSLSYDVESRSADNVVDSYKIKMADSGWQLDSASHLDGFYMLSFAKDAREVLVTVTKGSKANIVGINIQTYLN
jgi:hypothetical protein